MSERGRETREEKPQMVGEEEAGIALEDAFRLLSLAPRERLLSLTFKLGRSRTEELVHAMSLMGLGKEAEALSKLRALGDDGVARRLAEMLESGGIRAGATWTGGGGSRLEEPGVDSAIELARIFRLLADEKLCHESRRDRAYRSALWACSRPTGNGEGRGTLERLAEEAGEACGRHLGATSERFPSSQYGLTLRSGAGAFPHGPLGSRGSGAGSPAMRIQGTRDSVSSRTGSGSSPPSSLRTYPLGWASYPTHLELSVSPTALYDTLSTNWDPGAASPQVSLSEERRERTLTCGGARSGPEDEPSPGGVLSPDRADAPERSAQRCPLGEKLSESASLLVAPPGCGPPQRPPSPRLGPAGVSHVMSRTETPGSCRVDASESAKAKTTSEWGGHSMGPVKTAETPPSASASLSEDPKSETRETRQKEEDRCKDEDEGEEFFSFVILHSPADEELAGRLQEKLEALVVGPGATFTEDFAVPGKHRLSCVDDAINNSAFTILLLSCNFNPRMLEFESNCALMSSLENRHKSNTVIPLLPRENRLPRDRVPASLRIFVPLEEGARGFERKASRAMAPDRIARQRSVWRQEQRIRAQRRRERRARDDNERSAELLRGTELLRERLWLGRLLSDQQRALEDYQPPFGAQPGAQLPYWYPPYPSMPHPDQRPSIHIENASCIMIGNDSQMTVGTGGERPPREEGEGGPRREEREEGPRGEEQEST